LPSFSILMILSASCSVNSMLPSGMLMTASVPLNPSRIRVTFVPPLMTPGMFGAIISCGAGVGGWFAETSRQNTALLTIRRPDVFQRHLVHFVDDLRVGAHA
jgi:hypothetical protein